ncbi:hypothetical protein BDW22DRAFT_1353835 [Trametopsis cervina]|nr:hypothetical protein BDW22DRAFT_1353835 [Trametopsis cervina]
MATAQDSSPLSSPLSSPPPSPPGKGTQPAVQFPFQPGSPSTFVTPKHADTANGPPGTPRKDNNNLAGGRNPSLSPNSTSDSETTRSPTVSNASTGTRMFRSNPNSTDAPFNTNLLNALQQQVNDARQREDRLWEQLKIAQDRVKELEGAR